MKTNLIALAFVLATSVSAHASFTPVCDRTPAVSQALEVLTKKACADIAAEDLLAVKRVSVARKNIAEFRDGDFSGLTNLEILNIRSNPYKTLPRGLLAELPNLKTLVVIQVGLVELPEDFLEQNPLIENLHIHKNPALTRLPESVWTRLAAYQHWLQLDFDQSFATANPGRLEAIFAGDKAEKLILN
jgi:hypothetical protein